jgi:adenosylmethionine-8-amino-7-oxononanoate aminotransferase
MPNRDLIERDLRVLWHPCTQMRDHETLPPVPIARGEGAWLVDHEGRRYLDAISSWWVNLFGHGRAEIAGAIRDQLARLEHVMLAGFTHEPAVALAEALVRLTPAGLSRVFYTDNGASAVEVALKMSFHYWRNVGEPSRTRFVCLEGSYHGETLGALGVTDVALYREIYDPLIARPLLAPSPAPRPGEDPIAAAVRAAAALDRLLAEHAGQVAAVIVEPLVQCAAGMQVHDPSFLARVRAACDRHRVHLIADEIATGFGRTGTLFACDQAGIAPDFMCLSKGLTGGFLPLAAVLATEDVYGAFYADWASRRAFLHSHSYTGNPLACAAALATIGLCERTPLLADVARIGDWLDEAFAPLAAHPHVANLRRIGAIIAFDLVADRGGGTPYPWQERRGLIVHREALDAGVLLRPIGPVVYAMPPYVVTRDEVALIAEAAQRGVEVATRAASVACGRGPDAGIAHIDPSGLEV